jgi:L-fuconolactonase
MSPLAIDAHQSFWDPARREYPWLTGRFAPLHRAFGPQDVAPELHDLGLDGSILVQTLPSTDETVELLALALEAPLVRGVVGWVDLTADDVAERIRTLRRSPGGERLVGVRHRVHDEADPDWLGRPDVRRGLAAVATAGLAFDLHVQTRELAAAYRACLAVPRLRFVLDHLAAPPISSGDLSAWGRALLPLAELPNVSAKLGGLVTEADWQTWSLDDLRHPIDLALDAFGPRRLMLASDWPTCLLAGTYGDAIESIRHLLGGLPAHEQDEIMGGTATRVYGLARTGWPGGRPVSDWSNAH